MIEDTITVQKPVRAKVKVKDEPKWNFSQPSCSQNIASTRMDLFNDIKAAICAAHQPDADASYQRVTEITNKSGNSSLPERSDSCLSVPSNVNLSVPASSKPVIDSQVSVSRACSQILVLRDGTVL